MGNMESIGSISIKALIKLRTDLFDRACEVMTKPHAASTPIEMAIESSERIAQSQAFARAAQMVESIIEDARKGVSK